MTLDEFKKKTAKKKRAKIADFEADIFELINEGYALKNIVTYLHERGVTTCVSNISRFMSRKRKNKQATKSHIHVPPVPTEIKEQEPKVEDKEDLFKVKIKKDSTIVEAIKNIKK